jgi:predicted acetyltransferase
MGNIRLVEISEKDKSNVDIYRMLQAIEKEENGFGNDAFGLSFGEFGSYIEDRNKDKDEKTVKPGFAPQTIYWLYDDEKVIGICKMRHHLNDKYRIDCGHIGYAIRKENRNQGYGNKILNLTLKEYKKMGVIEILIVCEPTNTASRKIIESNGGKLEKETNEKCFYWISTN